MTGRAPFRSHAFAAMVTISLFAIWGAAQRIHVGLLPQFERYFHLSAAQITLTDSIVGLAYLFLALPAALLLRRMGYKSGIVFGLSGFSIGAFLLYGAIANHGFVYFVGAAAVIGASWALLETCANPLIMKMGTPETAIRRLNFAQCFYPPGLFIGFWLGPQLATTPFAVPGLDTAPDAMRAYVVVGLSLLFLAFLIDNVAFPAVATVPSRRGSSVRDELRHLLGKPLFRWGLAALAAYIVAQSCIWAFLLRYVPQEMHGTLAVSEILLWSWGIYGAGRILGTASMYLFDPCQLLLAYAGVASASVALAAATGGLVAVIALTACGFFMSIMFPTIFAASVRDFTPYAKTASGLLVAAAGLGVTVAAVIMAALWSIAPQAILVLCSMSFIVVVVFAIKRGRRNETSAAGFSGRA